MNKIYLFIFSSGILIAAAKAQSNCNNHIVFSICPPVTLSHETNAGMGDDAPLTVNIPGEDVVYEIHAPLTTTVIYVSIRNASNAMKLSLTGGNCNSGVYNTAFLPAGNSTRTFNVSTGTTYFLWVDASQIVTYDLSIGGDTSQTFINIPNTRGFIHFQNFCTAPVFHPLKPFFQVTYNGTFEINPMTLSPLSTVGTMCVNTFLANTTGIEGVKQFTFEFDSLGYSSVTTSSIIPGFFNAGNWIATVTGHKIVLQFVDAAGTGKGDFTGIPNNCLNYHFCFSVVPVSNDPQKTNVNVSLMTDGFGAGFTGFVHNGCCPAGLNCFGFGNGINSSGTSMGFGFNDPGTLPVELINFSVESVDDAIECKWSTASETNSNYFLLEKSNDAIEWKLLIRIEGAGNSTVQHNYDYIDYESFEGISYYRLTQVDIDGIRSKPETRIVNSKKGDKFSVYPNPVSDKLIVSGVDFPHTMISLVDMMNKMVPASVAASGQNLIFDTSHLVAGVYFLLVQREKEIIHKEKIIIQK